MKVVKLIHNFDFDYEIKLNRSDNKNMQYISCLIPVLQLISKALLDYMRIKFINNDLQKI